MGKRKFKEEYFNEEHHQENEQIEPQVEDQVPTKKKKKKKKHLKELESSPHLMVKLELEENNDDSFNSYLENEMQPKKKKKKRSKKEVEKFDVVQNDELRQNFEGEMPPKKKKRKQSKEIGEFESCQNDFDSTESTSSKLKKQESSNESDGPVEDLNEPSQSYLSEELPSIRKGCQIDATLVSKELLHILVPKLMRLNQGDIELLKENNLTVQNGRFTTIENAILQRNWKRYLQDYHIPNPALLLGHFQYERVNDRLKTLKKAYQKFSRDTELWLRLAKDLPQRTLYQIYCRARFLLSDLKTAKDFDDNDRQIILDLYKKHGDNYTSFCEKRGYNPKCAREVVRNSIKSNGTMLNRGEWTYDEVKKLRSVVDELSKELNLKSFEGIPWSRVAQQLKRSDVQCRQRFFTKTVFTMSMDSSTEWNDKFEIAKFIALLKHLNFSHQSLIDWDYIKEKFSSDFFNILLRKWQELRIRVPDHQQLSLPEILNHLYKKRVLKHFGNDPEKMKEIENFIKS